MARSSSSSRKSSSRKSAAGKAASDKTDETGNEAGAEDSLTGEAREALTDGDAAAVGDSAEAETEADTTKTDAKAGEDSPAGDGAEAADKSGDDTAAGEEPLTLSDALGDDAQGGVAEVEATGAAWGDAIPATDADGDTVTTGDAGPRPTAEGADHAASPNVVAPPPEPARRGGFFPMVLGGVVAAAIGFGASQYLFPQGLQGGSAPVADDGAAEARAALEARIAELEAGLAQAETALESAASDGGGEADAALGQRLDETADALNEGISSLSARIDGLDGTLETLTGRLDTLEAQGFAGGAGGEEAAAAISGYREEMTALREALDAQQSQNEALAGKVEAAAAEAEARIAEAEARAAELAEQARGADAVVAFSRLRSGVETGQPYTAALDALSGASDAELPEVLTANAASGVPSLAELQDSFAEAAREGLSASLKATVGDDVGSRFSAFVMAQVGARSLAPQEGDDPDAVLSRAEAALDAGDLGGALSELDALPEAGRTAMADWIAAAETRLAALESLTALDAAIGSTN